MKAIWNHAVIAESSHTEVVENNHYFPEDSVKKEFLTSSDTHSFCGWKGEASYYNIEVNGKINKDGVVLSPTYASSEEN